jgi:hypothetical protein
VEVGPAGFKATLKERVTELVEAVKQVNSELPADAPKVQIGTLRSV